MSNMDAGTTVVKTGRAGRADLDLACSDAAKTLASRTETVSQLLWLRCNIVLCRSWVGPADCHAHRAAPWFLSESAPGFKDME